jgi:hypothetical protein
MVRTSSESTDRHQSKGNCSHVTVSKEHVRYNTRIPASMITSVMNDWKKDPPLSGVKHPLNPGYGGGISTSVRSDNEVRNLQYYAHFRDLKDWWTFVNDETTPPTRIAAINRPILQSRRHTAHALIKRIASSRIKAQKLHAKTVFHLLQRKLQRWITL